MNEQELTIPFEIREFQPGKTVFEAIGITMYVFEDAACVAVPVVPGEYHSVDWLISMREPRRLIGIQFWDLPMTTPGTKRVDPSDNPIDPNEKHYSGPE